MATKRYRQLATHRAELDGKRKALTQEGHALSDAAEKDGRMFTEGERTRQAAILADLDQLQTEIKGIEADMEVEAKLEAHERNSIAPLVGDSTSVRVGPNMSAEFRSFGEFLQAIAVTTNSTVAARFGPQAEVLRNKMAAYQAAATGMSVGVPSDGGYMVRTDWSSAMLDRAREQAVIFPRCRQIPIGGDFDSLEYPYIDETSRATGSRWGGVQVYWKEEAATVTAKQPKIGKGELKLEELMGLAYATERLLRDSTALEGLLSSAFESEFAFVIDDAIFRGDGVGKPYGFFTSPVYATVAKESNQVADTVVPANLTKMYARVPSRLKSGAVWLIHPDVMSQLPLMTIGDVPVWLPPGNLTQSPNGLLLGKPVVEIEQASELGKSGDIVLAVLNEYVVITKAGEGLRYDTSMHVKFLYDEMAFRWVYRVNGQPTWKTTLTAYKGSSSLTPFIGIADRD